MDNSSKVIEDIKWFLYNNHVGFYHDTNFVSWVGDGHSFILFDGYNNYRISVYKEEE